MKSNFWLGGSLALALVTGSAQTALAVTANEVKQAIRQHPTATWRAGDTGAAENIGSSSRSNRFGLIVPTENEIFEITTDQYETAAGLPSKIDWRNKDGKNFMSPIKNQGRCGSCVAFASLATMEGQLNVSGNRENLNLDLSEQFLFRNIGSCDRGASAGSGLSSLQQRGAPDETCFPYTSGQLGLDQTTKGLCKDATSRSYQITSYKSVGASGLKAALQTGPVATTMTVYEDFMYYTGGIYTHVTGSHQGGHAITIVGYNDDEGAYIVKNSWGEDWGEKGYFRIAYNDASGLGNSNYKATVAAANIYAKLIEPQYFNAVAGDVLLKAEALHPNTKEVSFTLQNKGAPTESLAGQFNSETLTASLETDKLSDGVYELTLNSALQDGSKSRPWYSTLLIANNPQKVSLVMEPDFDNSKPVAGRVYYKLKTSYGQVPLTRVIVQFTSQDGKTKKTVIVDDPGKETKVGWRTASTPNGIWQITAIGEIGGLHQFSSNSLVTTVKNP